MKIIVRLTFLFLMFFVLSCIRNIKSAQPIFVPNNLSAQEVKIAILSAVNPRSKPIKLSQYQKITDSALRAHFGFRYQNIDSGGRWFIENIKKNSVMVGFENGKHYFRVEYIITKSQIIQRIDGSRNLSQTEDTIHKSVFRWLGQMESNIRQSMGSIVSIKPKTK